jgi:hypothetical protein
MNLRTTYLGLAVLLALLAVVPASAADDSVGRIVLIDAFDGILVVDFPTGRRVVNVDRRESYRFALGQEIQLDQRGAPVPVGSPRGS